jgi:hypothetical protein
MQKQITKCAFKIQLDVGNTNVSFQNSPLNVNIYSGSYSWEPYYFGGKAFDESVGGRLRSQLSGYRFTATLLWDRSTSQDNLLAIASNATFGTERTLLEGVMNDEVFISGFAARVANDGGTDAAPSHTRNVVEDIAADGLFTSTDLHLLVPCTAGKAGNLYTIYANGANINTINLSDFYNIPANDALNGLKITVGSNVRQITDSYFSNDTVILNAAVTNEEGDSINVVSNVDQRTYLTFFPDASNTAVNHDVIISSIDWTAALEATIVSLPVRVDLEGQDVQNTIPTYYKI